MLDFNEFKDKLGGWAEKFRPFIEGEEMWKIYERIREDAKREKIVPLAKDTFRAFSTTNQRDLKVIFYLMDPYPRLYKNGKCQATGIAMDCSNSPNGKLQPSLDLFYDAIERELRKERESSVKVVRNPSLEYLHEQGVMLLNTDLTCKLNKTNSHDGYWLPFQKYFLEEVVGSDTHLIYVLAGKISQKLRRYINPFAKVFSVEHPAAASHRNGDWESNGIFTTINQILRENNSTEIMWNKRDWEAPF